MKDYNGIELKDGDRVKSVYSLEPKNIGTIKGEYIVYDDEPNEEYQILDSGYLIKVEDIDDSFNR